MTAPGTPHDARHAPNATLNVLRDVEGERHRQNVKWGEQNHPNGTGPGIVWSPGLWAAEAAVWHRQRCQHAAALGTCTWLDILLEEIAEAFAEDHPEKLRTELVQVAAVAVQWIEMLDREQADRDEQDAMHSASLSEAMAEAAGE